jgi:HAE1 family hydrophobic/amphiphilic exporter-1
MLSRFFIDHPVFANVIAVITVLLGAVALRELPVEQYPQITPPTVQVRAVYPGANALVVADTVAAPIEQQVNGVEGMLYMSSNCSSDGSYGLTITFNIGTDLDKAQVLVQNRVAAAEPLLPEEVRRQGVTVRKQSTDIILLASLTSPKGTYNSLFMANYATLRLRDQLSRVPGVGDVRISGGSEYSMRIWLNPEELRARGLTTQDIVVALQEQNVQVAAGQIGAPPVPGGQQFQYTVTALGRLSEPEQFRKIIIKTGEEGRVTYLADVATVELGSQSYDSFASRNGRESASILIYQLPGANALEVARSSREALERLSREFPQDMVYDVPFDTTLFVQAGVHEVYRTLFEAGVLVLIVILAFLQSWRAVLVPATTVPVTIIGAFAFLWALGFSVNFLTLFGLVLAIGIVVDDAIVIVENAAHHIERGEPPHDATIRAMGEVTGPVIGITLVLMAVFLPASFMGGVTGQLYRQFALTIAATALISAINALTLKPAQCASWLRPPPTTPSRIRRVFSAPARAFNYLFAGLEKGYTWVAGGLARHPLLMLLLFGGLLVLTGWWYFTLPTGFLPTEDQGYAIVSVQLPDAASQQRTMEVIKRLDTMFAAEPGIANWSVLGGLSLLDGTSAPNAATVFIIFKPWEERRDPNLTQEAILGRLRKQFGTIQEAIVFPLVPPAIRGLGVSGGFQLQIQDRTGAGMAELGDRVQGIMEAARSRPELGPLTSTFRPGVPQLRVDVDRVKVKTMNLQLSDVYGTLQAYLGSAYVNDFNKFGRTYQVRVQAQGVFRNAIDDVRRLEVRNRQGQMVPLDTVLTVKRTFGPQVITRYNLNTTAAITGAAAPGISSGQALDVMEEIAGQQLPTSMGYDWTGIAYQERLVGGQALTVFGLAVLLVYLVLAAQYESWVLPLAVILVVPLGVLGAAAAVSLRGMDNNVYTQVGVVLIIALASKNAILIVEFARELRQHGRSITEAAVEAARLRFRPILMTSFAFILGVTPLVLATGAGAASRQSLGTAVFGGMITSTVLAVFFVPVFYIVMQWLAELRKGPPKPGPDDDKVPLTKEEPAPEGNTADQS